MKYVIPYALVAAIVVSCSTSQQREMPPQSTVSAKSVASKQPMSIDIVFTADRTAALEGDTVHLNWSVGIADSVRATVLLNNDTIARVGRKDLVLGYGTIEQLLSVRLADTAIDRRLQIKVGRKPLVTWTPDDVSHGPDDGRFTIGCRGERLTYGYPAPLSTSHMIVKVNGSYATNNPYLANRDGVGLLKGTAVRAGRIGFNRTEIPFRFYGVDVLQRVVPVDRSFREIESEGDAVYYKMSWTLTSRHTKPVVVGLAYLLDTMIDDNDAARVQADATTVRTETEFSGQSIPTKYFVYRRDTDASDLTAVYIAATENTLRPNQVIVGRWPFLYGQVWGAAEPGMEYYDSAIMTMWDDIKLEPSESVNIVSYYGTKQEYPIVMIDNNQNLRSETLSFQYDKAETTLRQADAERIRQFVSGRRIIAASVSGFSDAQGDDGFNLTVSRERANRIHQQLVRAGVDRRLIMLKAYGESQALQSPQAEREGVDADRRVDVNVWFE